MGVLCMAIHALPESGRFLVVTGGDDQAVCVAEVEVEVRRNQPTTLPNGCFRNQQKKSPDDCLRNQTTMAPDDYLPEGEGREYIGPSEKMMARRRYGTVL